MINHDDDDADAHHHHHERSQIPAAPDAKVKGATMILAPESPWTCSSNALALLLVDWMEVGLY